MKSHIEHCMNVVTGEAYDRKVISTEEGKFVDVNYVRSLELSYLKLKAFLASNYPKIVPVEKPTSEEGIYILQHRGEEWSDLFDIPNVEGRTPREELEFIQTIGGDIQWYQLFLCKEDEGGGK